MIRMVLCDLLGMSYPILPGGMAILRVREVMEGTVSQAAKLIRAMNFLFQELASA